MISRWKALAQDAFYFILTVDEIHSHCV